jgi:hypothetical protein
LLGINLNLIPLVSFIYHLTKMCAFFKKMIINGIILPVKFVDLPIEKMIVKKLKD